MIYIASAKFSAQALIPYGTQIFSTFPTEEKHLSRFITELLSYYLFRSFYYNKTFFFVIDWKTLKLPQTISPGWMKL